MLTNNPNNNPIMSQRKTKTKLFCKNTSWCVFLHNIQENNFQNPKIQHSQIPGLDLGFLIKCNHILLFAYKLDL